MLFRIPLPKLALLGASALLLGLIPLLNGCGGTGDCCSSSPTAVPTPVPVPTPSGFSLANKIVFLSKRSTDERETFFAMNPDGSGVASLDGLNNAAFNTGTGSGGSLPNLLYDFENHFLSGDRRKLILTFDNNTGGFVYVIVVNADGSGLTVLPGSQGNTQNVVNQGNTFALNSDGSQVIFASSYLGNLNAPQSGVVQIGADGSGQKTLFLAPSGERVAWPVFTPDNSRVVFVRDASGNIGAGSQGQIYVMNADGSGLTRLTNNGGDDEDPAFSPSGAKIVFTSTRDGGSPKIYVMNADGSGQTRLTNNAANDLLPEFSPDGTKIIFQSDRDGKKEIYSMNPDGSAQTRLTFNIEPDQTPNLRRTHLQGRRL